MKPDETPADVIREHAGERRSTATFVTLRDHFAGLAMHECLRHVVEDLRDDHARLYADLFAKAAGLSYATADAMLAARSK